MEKKLYALGIETSCDETAAAVVSSKYQIISNIIFSQQKLHASYFGVVPELASRSHYEKIHFVLKKATKNFDIKKLSLIAYTSNPGLKGALLIGKTVAKTLGYIYSIPVVGVEHLWGHIYSVILTQKGNVKFPFLSLIISGGHTELSIVESFTKRKILGQTIDDAVGEAFDKVAKVLHLTIKEKNSSSKYLKILKYPGGPIVEKLARYGNPKAINFPRPYMFENYNFSFSGLKTAVLYYLKSKKTIDDKTIKDICASFQEAVVDTLITKSVYVLEKFSLDSIFISGGVSSNNYLRRKFLKMSKAKNFKVYFPHKTLSTDNAAMIAAAGINFYVPT